MRVYRDLLGLYDPEELSFNEQRVIGGAVFGGIFRDGVAVKGGGIETVFVANNFPTKLPTLGFGVNARFARQPFGFISKWRRGRDSNPR